MGREDQTGGSVCKAANQKQRSLPKRTVAQAFEGVEN